MRCLTCGTKNPEGALYCGACGSALGATRQEPRRKTCGRCGTANDPVARYCKECGQELGVPAPLRGRVTRRRMLTFLAITGAIFLLNLIGSPTIVLVLAALPAIVCVTIAAWLDRFEPEPWWLVAGAFLWGASVAVLVSGIFTGLGEELVSSELGASAGNAYGASISAPFIEEITKGAALFAVYRWRRDELNGLLDGVIYASMVGLGFAMSENLLYYGRALQEGVGVLGQTFVLRGIILPFLHPLFTSATGIGLVLALRARDRRTKILAPILGLAAAMILHSAWNTNPVIFGPLLILPVFIAVLMLIRRSLRHETAVLKEYLPEGTVPPEDIESLVSFRTRIRDSLTAFRKGGFRAWAARAEYLSALSDLAFSRYHAATAGAPPEAAEPEGFRQLVRTLRREWRHPTTT